MSKKQDLLSQLDDILSMPMSVEGHEDGGVVDVEDGEIPLDGNRRMSREYDDGEESSDDTNFIGSYFETESVNSAKSTVTNDTSIGFFEGEIGDGEAGYSMKEKRPRIARRDNDLVHKTLTLKDGNLHNVLDCLSDMLEQETLMIQHELHNFIASLETSVANNTYKVPLFRKSRT